MANRVVSYSVEWAGHVAEDRRLNASVTAGSISARIYYIVGISWMPVGVV